MTLREYILGHYKEDSAMGDLADDCRTDGCLPRGGYNALRRHLEDHGACDDAIATLTAAHVQHQLLRVRRLGDVWCRVAFFRSTRGEWFGVALLPDGRTMRIATDALWLTQVRLWLGLTKFAEEGAWNASA